MSEFEASAAMASAGKAVTTVLAVTAEVMGATVGTAAADEELAAAVEVVTAAMAVSEFEASAATASAGKAVTTALAVTSEAMRGTVGMDAADEALATAVKAWPRGWP